MEFVQIAIGMKDAIEASFQQHNLTSLLSKIIYLSSDNASFNSGKKPSLIAQLQKDHKWILFVWCFSHRLELALKDTLVDESLMNLYYLHRKSSKKYEEIQRIM